MSKLFLVLALALNSALALSQVSEVAEPDLFGGRPVEPGELKVSVYIGNCTATIIGPTTIITAGHCRASGSVATFNYGGSRYSGRCLRHPQYSQNGWLNNDFALCEFSPAIEMPVWGSLEKRDVEIGEKLVMQGYGAGSNGKLNVAGSVVSGLNYMDIVTKGRVYLGGGDSGGALFAHTDDLVNGPFVIVGINSRGDNRNNSYFNRTVLERSQSWFHQYANSKNVKLCGINWDCELTPPPECTDEHAAMKAAESLFTDAKRQYKQCRGSHQ